MPTIKELYDLGQRQFPMRGGGVSPPLKKLRSIFICENEKPESWGFDEGNYCGWSFDGINLDDFHALDLLPIPLLNFNAHLQAITQAIGEQDDRA